MRSPVMMGALLVAGLSTGGVAAKAAPPDIVARLPAPLRFEVVATFPHDPTSFTEGLQVSAGKVYESAGLTGESRVQVSDLVTGTVLASDALPAELFGEGLALIGDRMIQLTWRDHTAVVRDRDTLAKATAFTYEGEGWGLCFDGAALFMTDGSDTLTVRDPSTFEVLRTVRVTRGGQPASALNELECAGGRIWANVWLTTDIVRIDPSTGVVDGVLDARPLLSDAEWAALDPNDVLNGIAIDESGRMFVTGKRWPVLYEIRIVGDEDPSVPQPSSS